LKQEQTTEQREQDINSFLNNIKRRVAEAKKETHSKEEFFLWCSSFLNISYKDVFMRIYWGDERK